jgi:hypothetical protein
MDKPGRKPGKILRAWEILTKKASEGLGLGEKTVYEPLELLQLNGPMSYGTASQILTRLENAGYIKKHTNGSTRLVLIVLIKDELGEDILGKQNQEPVQAATACAKTNTNGLDDVVVMCDFENLRITLVKEGAELKYNDLIVRARDYGNVVRSIAYVPMQTPPEAQMQLRMAGFRIESCPPRKILGKDTCDQAIEDFARFCLEHTNIGTFVLVSGDGDFVDILGEIENRGRKCVIVHYNYESTSKNLIARTSNIVNIASKIPAKPTQEVAPTPKTESAPEPNQAVQPQITFDSNGSKPNADTNTYIRVLNDLRDGKHFGKNNVHLNFLRQIIHCLRLRDLAWESTEPKKSISEITQEIWSEIFILFDAKLFKMDCDRAVNALCKFSILESRQQEKEPTTYYVLNINHELVARMLSA